MVPPATSPSSWGHGTVTAIDKTAGTITLNQGPIPEAKWPAMTMTFKASPEVVQAAKTGKSVTFTLNAAGDQVLSLK